MRVMQVNDPCRGIGLKVSSEIFLAPAVLTCICISEYPYQISIFSTYQLPDHIKSRSQRHGWTSLSTDPCTCFSGVSLERVPIVSIIGTDFFFCVPSPPLNSDICQPIRYAFYSSRTSSRSELHHNVPIPGGEFPRLTRSNRAYPPIVLMISQSSDTRHLPVAPRSQCSYSISRNVLLLSTAEDLPHTLG